MRPATGARPVAPGPGDPRRSGEYLAARAVLGASQLAEQAHPKLFYFNELDEGSHFAAWQEPELFRPGIRAAFGTVR